VTLQDVAAIAICALAGAWLLWRVFLTHGPTRKKPDVTTAALLKSTRARREARAGATAKPGDRHCH
jgi:hypothetical protein